jgi:sulfur carrier protein ThiS
MKVTVKLFATLAGHLPPAARRAGQVAVEQAPGSSVADLIAQLGLPPALCTLVLVDGRFVAPTDHAGRMLREGETVAIWPPIGGG